MSSFGLKSLYMLQGGRQLEVIFIATDLKKRTKMKVIGDVMKATIPPMRNSFPHNSTLVSPNCSVVS